MMKLILSFTLIWTLSSTAEAVECYVGHGAEIKQEYLRQCDSTELCATLAGQGATFGKYGESTVRMCLNSSIFSEGMHTYSFNAGFQALTVSVHVCNTDRCNSQAISYPGVQKKNNLQCFTCDDLSSAVCNKTVQCIGMEDRCINATRVDAEGKTFQIFGCISPNLCEVARFLKVMPTPITDSKILRAPKCCGSSFCNQEAASDQAEAASDQAEAASDQAETASAWSVKLNVIPLLFGLFTLIVY